MNRQQPDHSIERTHHPVISVMLAVPDATAAAQWYTQALGAAELWNMGGGVGLTVEGAPFFLGEPANNGWDTSKWRECSTVFSAKGGKSARNIGIELAAHHKMASEAGDDMPFLVI